MKPRFGSGFSRGIRGQRVRSTTTRIETCSRWRPGNVSSSVKESDPRQQGLKRRIARSSRPDRRGQRVRSTTTRIETPLPGSQRAVDGFVKESDPRQQGLKPLGDREGRDAIRVKESDPRQQGLKLREGEVDRHEVGSGQRVRSTTTRIETWSDESKAMNRPSQRVRSTTTRIETPSRASRRP